MSSDERPCYLRPGAWWYTVRQEDPPEGIPTLRELHALYSGDREMSTQFITCSMSTQRNTNGESDIDKDNTNDDDDGTEDDTEDGEDE